MRRLSTYYRRSSRTSRALFAATLMVGVGLVALIPLIANPRPAPREVVLVVRDMTFYLAGTDVPNPTIAVKPGEEVRLVLRNEQAGMTHDWTLASLHVALAPIRGVGSGSIVFRAPEEPGRHEYRCTPHAQMMKGVLLVE
jgi:hypothetical protein